MNRIEEIKKSVDEITSNDFCAKEMDAVGSYLGNSLEIVIHHAERYIEAYDTINKKIEILKQSSDYPCNFKGQMVEDFEWVLSILN